MSVNAGLRVKRKAWMTGYIAKQITVLEQINSDQFEAALQMIEACRMAGGQIFVVGNGGSAANASHFAQDLGKGASDILESNSDPRFRVNSLNDNVSWLTALGNDYSYEEVFEQQLRAHGRKGDVVIGISVSGTSQNVVAAFQYALDNSMNTIGLMGNGNANEENIHDLSDVKVKFVDDHFGRVEDAMMTFLHLICYFYMETAEDI